MNSTIRTAKILVVDDDPLNRELVARTLAHAGFATTTAASGEQAMEWITSAQFDAVVSDVQMPGMSGIELLQNIRARLPWLPVVIMTGHVEVDIRAAASVWGAAAVFQKPVCRGDVIAAISMALTDSAPPFAAVFASEAPAGAVTAAT